MFDNPNVKPVGPGPDDPTPKVDSRYEELLQKLQQQEQAWKADQKEQDERLKATIQGIYDPKIQDLLDKLKVTGQKHDDLNVST